MSNPNAEIAITGRVGDHAQNGLQISAGANFDALSLHREGATLRAPAVVAEANVLPAVYRPGENGGAVLQDVQYRERGHFPVERERGGLHIGVGVGVFDPFYYGNVAPYNYGYSRIVPETCVPSRYYGAPPVCFPVTPGFYGGYDRGYRIPEPHHFRPEPYRIPRDR